MMTWRVQGALDLHELEVYYLRGGAFDEVEPVCWKFVGSLLLLLLLLILLVRSISDGFGVTSGLMMSWGSLRCGRGALCI